MDASVLALVALVAVPIAVLFCVNFLARPQRFGNHLSRSLAKLGLTALLHVVKLCGWLPNVQASAVNGICIKLNSEPSLKPHVLSSGALPVVFALCRRHWDNFYVQATVLSLLGALGSLSPQDREAIVAAGAVKHIVTGMGLFPEMLDVQLSGCLALFMAVAHNVKGVVAFMDEGALARLFFAMDNYIAAAELQKAGCAILTHLTMGCLQLKHPDFPVVTREGLGRVLRVLQHYKDNAEMQRIGNQAAGIVSGQAFVKQGGSQAAPPAQGKP
jgi:hypothetical protein